MEASTASTAAASLAGAPKNVSQNTQVSRIHGGRIIAQTPHRGASALFQKWPFQTNYSSMPVHVPSSDDDSYRVARAELWVRFFAEAVARRIRKRAARRPVVRRIRQAVVHSSARRGGVLHAGLRCDLLRAGKTASSQCGHPITTA